MIRRAAGRRQHHVARRRWRKGRLGDGLAGIGETDLLVELGRQGRGPGAIYLG